MGSSLLLKNTNYGYIGIEGNRINYVGKTKPRHTYASVKDMSGKIVYPGLYNEHCHAPMTLLRGIGSGRVLQDWLFNVVFPTEDKLTPALVRPGVELAMLEMIGTGTVSFSDMYFLYEKSMESMINSGMRVNISRSIQSTDPKETYENNYRIEEAKKLYREYHGAAEGRMRVDFAIHAEYTNNDDIVAQFTKDIAAVKGRVQIHLSETKSENEACQERHGMSPTEWFDSHHVFDNPTIAAHCVALSDKDIAILKAHDVKAVHCPTSNMKLGSGFAEVPKMLQAGIDVCLGTDGAASNNNLNLIEEMHIASIIHNGYTGNPVALKPADIIRMATATEIKAGEPADLFAISLDAPHLRPNLDSDALLCYSAQGSDVCLTICDGNVLYEDGEYKTLDKERIYADVKKVTKKLYG